MKYSGTTGPADAKPRGPGLARAILGGTLLVGGIQVSIKVLGFIEKVILGNVYGTDSPAYAAYLVAFEVLLVFSEVLKLSVIPVLVPVLASPPVPVLVRPWGRSPAPGLAGLRSGPLMARLKRPPSPY